MQLNRLLILLPLSVILLCSSCKKNFSDEKYNEVPEDYKPDLGIRINSSIAGFVVDENNLPVGAAEVTSGGKTTSTDEFGYFSISNVSLSKTAATVTITRNGYYTNYRTFTPVANKESFVRLKLLTKTETGAVNGSTGGTVTAADGSKVTLPANGFITTNDSAAYNGQVHVSLRSINPSSADEMQLAFPGDGRGIDEEGNLRLLRSHAAVVVELTAENGAHVQIAAGKRATVQIPIAASLVATSPATIDLWSFDETTGLWKQEGTANKNGNIYVADVAHFSFWEGADPSAVVTFSAQLLNEDLQPLANVPVIINVAGQPINAGYGRFGYTDANGIVYGSVPANASLVLNIGVPCATTSYAHNFTTGNSSIDLGTLTGNLGQSVVTLTGNVINCSGTPVTNGYVQTFNGSFYNRINIVNGSFTFTGLACSNSVISYIAVDQTTHQQNTPQTKTLVPGNNTLGTIEACGISSVSSLTLIFDGVPYTYGDPTDSLAIYSFESLSTHIIPLDMPGPGNPRINFEIRGGISLGGGKSITDIWLPQFPSGRGIVWNGIPVTFTEYGNPGGFVSGNFTWPNVLDFEDSSIHSVSMSFRIKRYN